MNQELMNQIKKYCKNQYWSDFEEEELWEPFEDYSKTEINEMIEEDSKRLYEFITSLKHKNQI